MMTRAQIRRLIIDFVSMILVSSLLILVGVFFSMDKEEARVQKNYKKKFSDLIAASKYEELQYDFLSNTDGVNHVYSCLGDNSEVLGYIIDISVFSSDNQELHSILGISADGSTITGYKRVGDEGNPLDLREEEIDELSSQVLNKPMPVSLSADVNEDIVIQSEYDPPAGLQDGIFYAQTVTKDNKGYIDYVEIEIENGRIKRVQWDGINIDPTTGSRNSSSLTGAYVISGKNWATQSYNICHALIELQDVSRLAMKSDGTTEIVPDVTCNISAFVNLAQECLDNSKVGFDKEAYLGVLAQLMQNDGAYLPDITDANGYMVYPFNDLSVFQRPGSDSLIDKLSVYETTLNTEDIDEFEESLEESEITPEPIVTPEAERNGAEDGLVSDESQSIITSSIDGIPLSEVKTFIPGIPNRSKKVSSYITTVNIAYKFFKDYLNWIA